MRKHGRKDNNHNEIVRWGEHIGFQSFDTSSLGDGFPDSLMSFQLYRSFFVNDLWEIKDGKGKKLTEAEQVFFASWRGPRTVIRSLDDVTARREYWLAVGAALSTCGPLKELLAAGEVSFAQTQIEQMQAERAQAEHAASPPARRRSGKPAYGRRRAATAQVASSIP